MRFTVAAAILAQALPAFSQEDANVVTSLDVSPLAFHANSKAAIQKLAASSNRQGVKLGKGFKPALNQLAKKSRATVGAECKPDVGVLSCGTGMYCKSDDSSSLGGVCATTTAAKRMGGRKLLEAGTIGYDYCVAYAEEYDCDCTAWDADANSGYASCDIYSGYCFEVCPNICMSAGGTYTSDGENWEYTTCIDFTSPYEQHYCQSTKSDGTCEITLDGVACTSCEMISECGSFDCDNVGMGSGTFCYDNAPAAPIFYTCAVTGPYDPCYICPDGIANPDNLVGTPDSGYYTCSTLGTYAELGFVDATSCYYVQIALQEVCCGADIYKCNVCGEEGLYITQPNVTVSFPGAGSYSCAELVAGSELGLITSDLCPFVPAFASSPCGCTALDAPTEAPGTGSTTSPASPTTEAPATSPVSPATDAPTMTESDAPSMSPTMKEAETTPTASPTAAPTAGSGVTSKFAVTAVACATALVTMFSM